MKQMNDELRTSGTTPRYPSADFSYQLNIAREKVEKKIYQYLCELSKKLYKEKRRLGVLVVVGHFETDDGIVYGMRPLGNNQIQKYINVCFGQFESDIMKIFEDGEDGAIIVSQNGQILGTRMYLTVDNPSVEIPEGAGTRHISAASFSTRKDVVCTFTLSEETLAVRMWQDGTFVEQFMPGEKDEDE
jgi:DNA integrity scanning protein DisA with diadenylate cyclase activity